MKEKVKFYGSICILVIFIPYLITVYLHGSSFRLFSAQKEDGQLEQEVLCVLASEIPADDELECLKAQAVIARTNLYRERYEESSAAVAGWTDDEMRAAWGDAYKENLKKMETAVSETTGVILTFDGKPIQAAFHTACNKKTRDAAEVPGQEACSEYLQSVESAEDILADGFLSITYMEKADFAAALAELFAGETLDAESFPASLQIVERDSADYVTKVQYGETVANGEAVRAALGLNSACFYLSELDGKVRIVTKGIGHGLGFSQCGAQRLAEDGADYRELLEYYYQGVEFETITS